jgi:hypothetical protein
MYLSRAAIALLSTVLGCRQFTNWVEAFGRSSLPHSHISPTKLSVALESAEEQAEENDSFEKLMDEAVLLYSVVSQRTKFDDNTEAQHDILKLRGNELTSLIEDAVFDTRGILRDGLAIEEPIITSIVKEKIEPETIEEISQALDDQIILGYEATFTEEELEKWIGGIDALQQKLQSQLAALPPASDASTETLAIAAIAAAPPTPLDRMHVRLELMRTLIDPEGRDRLRLPLARPTTVPKQNVESRRVVKPVPSPSPPTPEPNTEVKGTNENDNSEIEIMSKEFLPEIDATTEIEIENASIEAMNKSAESTSIEATKINTEDVDIESSKDSVEPLSESIIESVSAPPPLEQKTEAKTIYKNENPAVEIQKKTSSPDVDAPTTIDIENAFIEAINKAAESTSNVRTKIDIEDVVIESSKESVEPLSESVLNAVLAPSPLQSKTEAKTSLEKEDSVVKTQKETSVPEEDSSSKIEMENAFFEALNKAAEPASVVDVTSQDEPEDDCDLVETHESLKTDSQNDKLIMEEDDDLVTTKADERINVKVQKNNDGETIDTENVIVGDYAEISEVTSSKSDGGKVELKQITETSEDDDSSATDGKEERTEQPSNSITPNDDGEKSEEGKASHTEESDKAAEPPADAATGLVVPHYDAPVDPRENADVVSTVVTAAAFGAVAITANPLMFAGVALGPVIRESIASAKSRMKKHASIKSTEKKATPKKKPRARSAFDKKEDGEDGDEEENDDESKPNTK